MAGYKLWVPDDPLPVSELNGYLMDQAVFRFPTTSARDTALSSPSAGHSCYCADTGELYVYRGGKWTGMVPRTRWKDTDTSRASTTTYADDPDIQINLEANSMYVCDIGWMYTAHTSGDIKWVFTYSGTLTYMWISVIKSPLTVDNPAAAAKDLNTYSGTTTGFSAGGYNTGTCGILGLARISTTTAGTLKLQWAQNTSYGTASVMKQGSYMDFLKVA